MNTQPYNHEVIVTSNQAPGPQGFAVFRHVAGFYSNALEMFAELAGKYGPVARLELGPYCLHLLSKPEHLKHVLVDNASNYRKSQAYGQTQAVVGFGLANNSDGTWRRRRQLVEMAFQTRHLAAYSAIAARHTQALVARWGDLAAKMEAINVWLEIMDLHYVVLGETLFGPALIHAAAPVRDALDTVRDVTTRRINALVNLPDALPTPENRKFHRAVAILNEFVYEAIRTHRAQPDDESVLSQLCHLTGDGLTDEELRDELMSLFFSGYEDSVNALTWALYLLAQHPQQADLLRDELRAKTTGDLTYEDLEQLDSLKAVVHESLRLYPPSWGIMRDAVAEDEIDGYQIPAGSIVFLPIYLIHQRPDIWHHNHDFNPHNFAHGQLNPAQVCAYQPFGVGERQCIANNFALAEIQLILAMMIQKYQFELLEGYPVDPLGLQSMRPRNGLLLKVRPVGQG